MSLEGQLLRSIAQTVALELPRIVVCSAPAGYGKSIAAGQIASLAGEPILFDAAREPVAEFFARRGGQQPQASIAVIDNVEVLDDENRALLALLLSQGAAWKMSIVCSRVTLDVPASRSLHPGDVLRLSAADLGFTEDEIAQLFGDGVTPATLARVYRLSRGWPLAVAFLERQHRFGRLDAVLDDRSGIELRGLEAYIDREIVSNLTADQLDLACALAVTGGANDDDLGSMFARNAPIEELPLTQRDSSGTATVHPLLATCLARSHAERYRAVLDRTLTMLVDRGARVRAAQIALAHRDHDRAAALIEGAVSYTLAVGAAPPIEAGALIAALPRRVLLERPDLWDSSMMYRRYAITYDEWLGESLGMWRRAAPETPLAELIAIARNVSINYVILGRWETLEAFRAEAAERYALVAEPTDPQIVVMNALTDGWIAAVRSQPFDVDQFLAAVEPLFTSDILQSMILYDVISRAYGDRGDRDAQRKTLETAVVVARRSAVPSLITMTLEESATSAWLAGEDELFERCMSEIEAFVETVPSMLNGVGYFLDCARGRGLRARPRNERPSARVTAMLIAAGSTTDLAERRAHLDRAILEADACRLARPMILTRLARAEVDPEESAARRDEAHKLALSTCISSTMLEWSLSRFRAPAPKTPSLSINLLEGTVDLAGTPIHVSQKEFMLLAVLALADAPIDRDILTETLWPASAPNVATGTLRVCISRVRARIRDASAISADKGRYRLSSRVTTDLDQIDALTRHLPEQPTTADVEAAMRMHAALIAGPPAFLLDLPALTTLHPRVNLLLERVETWLLGARWRVSASARLQIDRVLTDADAAAG